jgi:hypothetical protein
MRFANTIGSRKRFFAGLLTGYCSTGSKGPGGKSQASGVSRRTRCCTSPAVLRFSDDDGLPCPTTQCRRAVRSCPGGKLSNAELERNALCRQCPADSESVNEISFEISFNVTDAGGVAGGFGRIQRCNGSRIAQTHAVRSAALGRGYRSVGLSLITADLPLRSCATIRCRPLRRDAHRKPGTLRCRA